MGNIVLLDELTINKIAAGEVIERPASVVKEMVENSIDAGATNINIEIKNGGISYIRITDNGKGILPDDMEIAFEKNATSKIRHADDLETVTSMGFRGEALASVAAIAKVTMTSRTKDNDTGFKIVIEGGNVLEKEEVGCPIGTTIAVENLFFNTPVRYKFLKKDFTESGYIEDAITRISLVHPNIAFKLNSSGKTIVQTTGNNELKTVVYNIFGKDIAENVLPVEYTHEEYKVTGFVGKPEIARSNRTNQMFFVNKRFVRDKTLSAAVEQSFKGLLPIGKFAFLILNIEMTPKLVDVNVHPAKLEVRFQEEQKVFKAIYHAIKETLLAGDLIANTSKEKSDKLEAFAPKYEDKNAIVGMFRKLVKNSEKEAFTKDNVNVIEDIYKTRSIADIQKELKENVEKYQKDPEIKKDEKIEDSENPKLKAANSIMEKMLDMQQKVQNEMEKMNIVNIAGTPIGGASVLASTSIDSNTDIINTDNKKLEEDNVGKLEELKNTEEKLEISEKDIEEKVEEVKEEIINEEIDLNPEVEELVEEFAKLDKVFVKETLKDIENIQQEATSGGYTKEFEEMYLELFGVLPSVKVEKEVEDDLEKIEFETPSLFEKENIEKREYKFIGIVFTTYIIIEIEKEMYIIDQHAAHERVMYEKVKENFYSNSQKDSQLMLLPDLITLTHKEMDIAKDNFEMFRKAGFELEEFGDNTIKIAGVPTICLNMEIKDLFLEILDEIDTVARTARQEIEEKYIATVACKAAVKANMALAKEEVDSLIKQLLVLNNPFTCPHGRPTAIKMTKNDIEKKFSRR